jgi:hypothetical protein
MTIYTREVPQCNLLLTPTTKRSMCQAQTGHEALPWCYGHKVPVSKSVHPGLGMVVHTCNPSYWGGMGGRITVQCQQGQKCETLFEKLKAIGLEVWIKW